MKKVYTIGMVLMMAATFAYAASLAVPWFVDNSGVPGKLPPVTTGILSLIYLHNNLEDDVVCEIAYYSATGHFMGPVAPDPTTFTIPALSTVAFRPCKDDPSSAGGQEAAVAQLIPNRPTVAPDAYQTGDEKPNGAIVIRWTTGGANDVQGIVLSTQNADGGAAGRLMQWGTLLPPGV